MNGAASSNQAAVRHRTTLVIWGAQLMSLVLLFLLTRFVPREGPPEYSPALLGALAVAALSAFGASFVIKAKLLAESVVQQRPEQAQAAYVVAFALCEAAALLGVVAHFVTGVPESVYFFALAALGLLIHFPRRSHYDEASGGPPGVAGGGPR